MQPRLLHIYRNTPFGRETLLHSAHFCKTLGFEPVVYLPRTKKLLFYFEFDAVQVDLDDSYLASPATAFDRAKRILDPWGLKADISEPGEYSASNLADVPTDFECITLPRAVSEKSSKIGLGYLGSRVRKIMVMAHFPVFVPCPVFKPWTSLAALFGGSDMAVSALRIAFRLKRLSGRPLRVYSQAGPGEREELVAVLERHGLSGRFKEMVDEWVVFEEGEMSENLFDVPHDALVLLGAFGKGVIRDIMFGSTMEMVQTTLPNSLLVVGPKFTRTPW